MMAFEDRPTLRLVSSIFSTGPKSFDGEGPQTDKENKFVCVTCKESFVDAKNLCDHRRNCNNPKSQTRLNNDPQLEKGSHTFTEPRSSEAIQPNSIEDNANMIGTGGQDETEGSYVAFKGRKFQCKKCPKWFACAKNLWSHRRACRNYFKRKTLNSHLVKDAKEAGTLREDTNYDKTTGLCAESAKIESDDSESDDIFKPNNFSKLFGAKNGKVENKETVKHYSLRKRNINGKTLTVCDNSGTKQEGKAKLTSIRAKCSVRNGARRKRKRGSRDAKKIRKRIKKHCTICNKLMDQYSLKQHMLTHSAEKPFSCQFCDFCCVTLQSLVVHVRRMHCSVKPFKCEKCGKAFSVKSLLNQHLRAHSNGFRCGVCGKDCNSSYALKVHEISHNRTYACNLCNKTFKTAISLKLHCNSHVVTKPYEDVDPEFYFECPECEGRYRTRTGLTDHMKTHCDTPQFRCQRCPTVFGSRYMLTKHTRLEHGVEKMEVCLVCGSAFASEQKLMRHMQIH